MARSTQKEWKQAGFYGGFSDDKFMGIPYSFQYAKGIEIRKNPGSIKLANAMTKISSTEIDAKCRAMVTIKSTGDVIMFLSNGKILRRTAGSGTIALAYTDSSGRDILNGFEYNGYLYWFTAEYVHRIAVANIDATWSTDVAENYKTFTVKNTNAHPAIELFNKLYIGDGYLLAELDNFGTFTANKLTIFNDEEIRAITFGGTMMRLFSRKTNLSNYGAKYYWNGSDEDYTERVELPGQILHTAISHGGDDYVLAGKRPYLYLSSGYDYQPIKRLYGVNPGQSAIIAPNAINYYDNLLCIGMCESGSNSCGRGVWTFGQEDTKYPAVLNFEYPTSNDNLTDNVYCIHNSNDVLYVSWMKTAAGPVYTYGIDIIDVSKYRATGELISRAMYGDKAAQLKTLMKMEASFAQLAAGERIDISLIKNITGVTESTPELTIAYTDEDDRSVNDKSVDDALDGGDFNFLQTKILLTAGTSQATTPELVEVILTYDEVEVGDNTEE